MPKRTNHALIISLGIHIAVVLAVSPFFVNHFDAEKEHISADILKPEPEKQIRKRILPIRTPLIPQTSEAEASDASPASPTYSPEVSVPKAPVHDDVTPDVVTYADVPQTDAPSPVSNASFGEDGTLAGPVVVDGQRGAGVGRPGHGQGSGNNGIGDRFTHGTGAADAGLGVLDGIDVGLGIFGTDVMPGHGLIGQVYVPGGVIQQMPDFDQLTPVYTFVTPNLDISEREYTQGFPTPEMQSVVEDFAIRFRGELAIDTPGSYVFGLLSDDGAKLYINGTLVVDNDGIHPAMGKKGEITLEVGRHPVEIHYFQGPRYSIALQWTYQPPTKPRSETTYSISVTTPERRWNWQSGVPETIVPPEIIYPPGKPRVPKALRKLQQRLKNIKNTGEQ
ncbi:hypothetical protein C6496_07710 [Candidatus Poribacteria bacterium]|nr:MAG: hypothetical protein C6496_07710 [Candidatus Poribacteria bacterium]